LQPSPTKTITDFNLNRGMSHYGSNNRLEVERNLLKTQYSNVKLRGLKYYKVSEVFNEPTIKSYIDTKYSSRTKTSFMNNFDLSQTQSSFNRK
jgi:hypothetical protein